MLIYHGTNSGLLKKIADFGIRPRGKGIANWKTAGGLSSHVYLSLSNAVFYAIHRAEKLKDNALILELELDRLNRQRLYPDDDFIIEAFKLKPNNYLDKILGNQSLWLNSLEYSGSISHAGGVSVEMLTGRYAIIDIKARPDLVMNIDPCVSCLNFKIMGGTYRNFIAWLFGDPQTFPTVVPGYLQDKSTTSRAGVTTGNFKK